MVKTAMNPSAQSIAVSKIRFPRQVVAIQLKIFTPVGTAIVSDAIMNQIWATWAARP